MFIEAVLPIIFFFFFHLTFWILFFWIFSQILFWFFTQNYFLVSEENTEVYKSYRHLLRFGRHSDSERIVWKIMVWRFFVLLDTTGKKTASGFGATLGSVRNDRFLWASYLFNIWFSANHTYNGLRKLFEICFYIFLFRHLDWLGCKPQGEEWKSSNTKAFPDSSSFCGSAGVNIVYRCMNAAREICEILAFKSECAFIWMNMLLNRRYLPI